ncbi:MAG: lamin tail domain-containing protein [Chloroflexi bacterium]|nr:lamin tail domain-containing protein [Chloroflexota bacterium]
MACGLTKPTPPASKPKTQPPTNTENQTPTETSPPEETKNEAEWSTIQTFTGKDSKDTTPFHVSGTEWRIIWAANAERPEYAVFDILVYPQDKPGVLTKRISYSKGTSSDTAYIYEGGRDYYLKVTAANLSSWTITVEEPASDYTNQKLTSPVQITKINYKGQDYIKSHEAGYDIIEFDEYVEIKNLSDSRQNIAGWVLKNLTKGGPAFVFPTFMPCSCQWYGNFEDCIKYCSPPRPCAIDPHRSIRVYTGEIHHESGGFCFCLFPGDIWNNEIPDTAVLYNLEGQEVSRKSYIITAKNSVTSGE